MASSTALERGLLVAAGGGSVVFAAALASVALGGGLVAWDAPAARVFASSPPALQGAASLLALVGEAVPLYAALGLAAAVLAFRGRRWGAARTLLIPAANDGIVTLVKLLVARARPENAIALADGYAFPSGHAARAVVVACLVAWFALRHAPGRPWVVLLVCGAVAWTLAHAAARLVLGVHYATDVLAGAGLGVAVGCAGLLASLRLERAFDRPRSR